MDEVKQERSELKQSTDVQALWSKYEEIAMHFNDLLMRLRSQSLAGIAAIATLVGVFAKEDVPGFKIDWTAATAILCALALFWAAIFFLDIFYYNRLLGGAVAAIIRLEAATESKLPDHTAINMSTIIEDEFKLFLPKFRFFQFAGVYLFYGLVLLVIILGLWYSSHMSRISH